MRAANFRAAAVAYTVRSQHFTYEVSALASAHSESVSIGDTPVPRMFPLRSASLLRPLTNSAPYPWSHNACVSIGDTTSDS